MGADAKIMEALARIEHKQDLQLKLAAGGDPKLAMKQVGDTTHLCPLCRQAVDYQIDVGEGVIIRKCGCSTGKLAVDLSKFAPPVNPTKKDNDNEHGSSEEDGDYSRGYRGHKRR